MMENEHDKKLFLLALWQQWWIHKARPLISIVQGEPGQGY